jgi:hypothetical protein
VRLFFGGPSENDGRKTRSPLVTVYFRGTRYRIVHSRVDPQFDRTPVSAPNALYISERCGSEPVTTSISSPLIFIEADHGGRL